MFATVMVSWNCGNDKIRSGVDLNGDNSGSLGPICYLRISYHCRVTVLFVRIRISVGLGLRIVVYKPLEKVTKCGSIT